MCECPCPVLYLVFRRWTSTAVEPEEREKDTAIGSWRWHACCVSVALPVECGVVVPSGTKKSPLTILFTCVEKFPWGGRVKGARRFLREERGNARTTGLMTQGLYRRGESPWYRTVVPLILA